MNLHRLTCRTLKALHRKGKQGSIVASLYVGHLKIDCSGSIHHFTNHSSDSTVFDMLLRSEIPSGICAKLRTVAASNNRVHMPWSLYYCLFEPHICMVLFFTHIPFVVNHTINATPPERLQQCYHPSSPFQLWVLLARPTTTNTLCCGRNEGGEDTSLNCMKVSRLCLSRFQKTGSFCCFLEIRRKFQTLVKWQTNFSLQIKHSPFFLAPHYCL